MRNKDHHLLLRGRKYYIRYDIPTDLRDCFPGVGRTVYEALGTGDKIEARKRRDRRLRELEQGWYRLRQAKKRRSASATGGDTNSWEGMALQVASSDDPDEHETFSYLVTEALDRLAEPYVRSLGGNHHDYINAAEEVKKTPEGQRLMAALQIASGKATPIRERSRGETSRCLYAMTAEAAAHPMKYGQASPIPRPNASREAEASTSSARATRKAVSTPNRCATE